MESTSSRPRPGGRSARVVRDVLAATIEEFARVGYAGLSIEEVATRAGVNKTTVYRRWPTKLELLRAALLQLHDEAPPPPDSGDLREDLRVLLSRLIARLSTPRGMAVARAVVMGGAEAELAALRETVREQRPVIPKVVVERAIARGELPAEVDVRLLRELLVSPIQARLFWTHAPVDAKFLERLVDVVVSGVQHVDVRKPRALEK